MGGSVPTGCSNRPGSGDSAGPTPIEDPRDTPSLPPGPGAMATVVEGSYTPLNGRVDAEDDAAAPKKKRNLLDGDAIELAQVINHPAMKKAESMEVLNLSLHQVR